jgi:hypothetical protein
LASYLVPALRGRFCILPCTSHTAGNYVLHLWHSVLLGRRVNLPPSCVRLYDSLESGWCVALTCQCCRFIHTELGPGWYGVCRLCPYDVGPVSHRIQFSLIHSLLLFPRKIKREKRKEKRETWQVAFPEADWQLCWSHANKSCFKSQSLNFMCTLCIGNNLAG